jgi:hypothetical protein
MKDRSNLIYIHNVSQCCGTRKRGRLIILLNSVISSDTCNSDMACALKVTRVDDAPNTGAGPGHRLRLATSNPTLPQENNMIGLGARPLPASPGA